MSDDADHSQKHEEAERHSGVSKAILSLQQEGCDRCIDCGTPIGDERRKAMPSAQRCIWCQNYMEGMGR
jgi:phage/conjugal plasmid C-4 type zinc finger TraR family protein